MKDLHINKRLDFERWLVEHFRTAPLEDILKTEVLAAMRGDGMTDEDIREMLTRDDTIQRTEKE